jgi:hypothetical protein
MLLDDPMPVGPRANRSPAFFSHLPDLRGARAAIALENVTDLTLRDLRIDWPSYPVPDWWNLLRSPMRAVNAEVYHGNEDRIARGEMAPKFHALWGRNVLRSTLDLSGVTASDGAVNKAMLLESDAKVL